MPVLAQELSYRVVEKSPYNLANTYNYVGDLQPGEVVRGINVGWYTPLTKNGVSDFTFRFTRDNEDYATYARNLVPLNTESLFGPDVSIDFEILTAVYRQPSEMWVPHYYTAVLQSKDRDTLTKFESYLLEHYTGEVGPTYDMYWYNDPLTYIRNGMSMLYNSMIYAGWQNKFSIENIKKQNMDIL